MNNGTKISNEQFLSILRENAGLFAKTARAIQKQYGIDYSRQAVRDRASHFPDEVFDIKEENLDTAEEGLYSLMKSETESIKLRAIDMYLKTQGKGRGYIERTEHEVKQGISINIEDASDRAKESIDKLCS